MSQRTWKLAFSGDIRITGIASCFGGPHDSGDDGETASGVDNTKYGVLGCALPIPTCPATAGSPLPRLPYKTTMVEVTADNGRQITVPLIDVGPAMDENRPIDLTPATFVALGGDLEAGLMPVSIRIIGAATYFTA